MPDVYCLWDAHTDRSHQSREVASSGHSRYALSRSEGLLGLGTAGLDGKAFVTFRSDSAMAI
eukprot:scaffold570139_cov34-Prasinocladus_malaysianus.AAC.1